MTVTLLFVVSALSFSGFVSAGRRDTGPKGSCVFNVGLPKQYALGEVMTILVQGDFGKATAGFFEFDLKNPSGAVVMKSYWYFSEYPTGFDESKTYQADSIGTWTAELTYNVPAKRNMKTIIEGFDQVPVIA